MVITMDPNERRIELLCEIAAEVEMLRTSKGWTEWLAFARHFRTYSLNNQLLIHRQRPDATRVAGFRKWQSLGRQVRRHEQGIAILAPLLVKGTDREGSEDRPLVRLKGFRIVHVFDIAQTEGEPEPEGLGPFPEITAPDPMLLVSLIAAASRAGIGVAFSNDTSLNARGWYDGAAHNITLVECYSTPSQIRTMLHELGHACDDDLHDLERTRAQNELVAESAAYLVGSGKFGLKMSDSSAHYLTGWNATLDGLVAMAEQVLKTATRVEELLADLPDAA